MVGDIERVLAALHRAEVRYLVVGGVAVVLHGYLRTTVDLDLVVQLEEENLSRALRALAELGYRPRAPVAIEQFADRETREEWIREKSLQVFSLWSESAPTLEVDLFVTEPFDFDEVHARAVQVELETTPATVISRADLIELKRAAGRPQDRLDIEALEELGKAEGTP